MRPTEHEHQNVGWVCPKCGRVYSQNVEECADCRVIALQHALEMGRPVPRDFYLHDRPKRGRSTPRFRSFQPEVVQGDQNVGIVPWPNKEASDATD